MELERYNNGAARLTSKRYIPSDWVFDYSTSTLAELFDRFYRFCQDNLDNHCNEFAIQPATFFYKNDISVNAAAGRQNDDSIMFLNSGTLVTMYQALYNGNKAFLTDEYLKMTYTDILPQDTPPDFIMYQITIQFTYYHELAHLIQRSPQLSSFIMEAYALHGPGSVYDHEKHLKEFDADLHAAQMIYFHIYEFWGKLPVDKRDSDRLGKMVSLYLCGMLFYLSFLSGRVLPIYFEESDHPHPLIRVTYIMDIILGVAEQHFSDHRLDGRVVLRETFNIAERICKANGQDSIVEGYAGIFMAKHEEITAFINKLISDSDKLSYLVKNRPQTS